MIATATAPFHPTIVPLKTLNLVPFGKLKQDSCPGLVLHEDNLELRWNVEGQPLSVAIPRSGLRYNMDTINEPFFFELYLQPGNQLMRFFLDPAHVKANETDVTSIIAIARLTGCAEVPWLHWVKGMHHRGRAPGSTSEDTTFHLAKVMTISGELASLSSSQLRKTVYRSTSPMWLAQSTRTWADHDQDDDQKTSEYLDCESGTTQEAGDGANEHSAYKPDETLNLDTQSLLTQMQNINNRIQLQMTSLAEQREALATKEAMLEQRGEEIASKAETLRQQEENLARDKALLKQEQEQLAVEKEEMMRIRQEVASDKETWTQKQEELQADQKRMVHAEDVLSKAIHELHALDQKRSL